MTRGAQIKPIALCPGCGLPDHLKESGYCYDCNRRLKAKAKFARDKAAAKRRMRK